jgi:hypothetical protein
VRGTRARAPLPSRPARRPSSSGNETSRGSSRRAHCTKRQRRSRVRCRHKGTRRVPIIFRTPKSAASVLAASAKRVQAASGSWPVSNSTSLPSPSRPAFNSILGPQSGGCSHRSRSSMIGRRARIVHERCRDRSGRSSAPSSSDSSVVIAASSGAAGVDPALEHSRRDGSRSSGCSMTRRPGRSSEPLHVRQACAAACSTWVLNARAQRMSRCRVRRRGSGRRHPPGCRRASRTRNAT